MQRSIAGSVAFITGASRGIGRAIATVLAEEGCHVALAARNAEKLERAATDCRNRGVHTLCLPLDVTDSAELKRGIDQAVRDLGGLDILVNNAGMGYLERAAEADVGKWARLLDTNLRAAMEATRFSLPHLKRRGGGAVVFIASISSKITYAGGAAYCASKHGLLGFSGAVFEEVRGSNIKVCSICPGYVDTEMVGSLGLPKAALIQPEDVAEAVRFVVTFGDRACPTEITLRAQRPPPA